MRCALTPWLVLLWSAALLDGQQPAAPGPAALQSIRAEQLLAHARFLAADERGGRMTATPGQHEAAAYVVEHFRKLGLEPLGDLLPDGSRDYLQHYPLRRLAIGDETQLAFAGEVHRRGFGVLVGEDSTPQVAIDGEWVLEGWRASRSESKLDGKVPVLLLREPALRSSQIEVQMSTGFVTLARLRGSIRRLHERGAKAVVVCVLDDDGSVSNALNYVGLIPGKPMLSKDGATGIAGLDLAGELPVVFTSAGLSRSLLTAFGLTAADWETLSAADRDAQETAIAKARPLVGKLTLNVEAGQADATNVVAVLRGDDRQRPTEAVLYSAHMDHVGTRLDGAVFNGADDNASGTAGLLEIARAWAESPQRPARSIVFLVVSGEELGLWGSEYFTESPTWPLAQVVANINTDMIGRNGPESGADEVMVTPSYGHRAFSTLVRSSAACAAQLGLRFVKGDKYYMRSDHYNFALEGIPVVFFCNGEHEDYHQVTDTADKLDGDKMERIARLAFWTGWLAAQTPERPLTLGRSGDWSSGEDK